MTEAFLIGGVRTPIGRYGGALSGIRPDDLAALVVRTAVDRAGVPDAAIDEVVVTDTVPLPADKVFPGLTILPIAPLLARAIQEVFEDGSVTSMFDGAA